MRRYEKATTIFPFENRYGVSYSIPKIRAGIDNGTIRFKQASLKEGERLDVIAAIEYGDGKLAWIIAAASDIGFIPQTPPSTLIRIPVLQDISRVLV